MTTTALKAQSWIERQPGYWRGRAMVRLLFAKEIDCINDQIAHASYATEYEAKAAELEGRAVCPGLCTQERTAHPPI